MMTFFPWQNAQWQQLTNSYIEQKLSHALLLNGQPGLGKFQFANHFAKFLLCKDPKKNSNLTACNHCKSCNLIDNKNHPDLQCLVVEEDASVIKLEQIKKLNSVMNTTAQLDGYKVIIIYPTEKMNLSAANALLKNLEEPISDFTLFMLITHQCMNIPATIRSRCQRINFNAPQYSDLQQWFLEYSINVNSSEFCSAYQLSQGAPLLLQHYLNQPAQLELWQIVNELLNEKTWQITAWSHKLSKYPSIDFINVLQLSVMNLIKSNTQFGKNQLYYLLDEINNHKKAVNNGIALNAQLLVDAFLTKIKQLN